MNYEVERRVYLKSKKEIDYAKRYFDENAKVVGVCTYNTFLFKKPNYLRIRYTKDDVNATITIKQEYLRSKAREETEREIKLKNLPQFVERLKTKGYKECVYFKSINNRYSYKGFTVDITKHDWLGTMLEIEKITRKKEKIEKISTEIKNILKQLNFKEVSSQLYKKKINNLYSHSKNISEYKILMEK